MEVKKPRVTVNSVQEMQKQQGFNGAKAAETLSIIGNLLLFFVRLFYYIGESIYKKFTPIQPKSVKGEIVLITGTGHGIGKELALAYASEGATVVGLDINAKNCEETVREIAENGHPKAYSYVCDISNRKNVEEVAAKIKAEVGEVTVLINNAGIMPCHPFLDHTPEEIEKIMGVNVMAHFWTIRAFLPGMIKNNNGHIVSLSSMAGLAGIVNLVPYCASKFAVRGLMESLHEELRTNPTNRIRLTNVSPYMVDTGLCKRPKIKYENIMPLLSPKEVAHEIMKAQRCNELEITIPRAFGGLVTFGRLLPYRAAMDLKDTYEAIVESDQ